MFPTLIPVKFSSNSFSPGVWNFDTLHESERNPEDSSGLMLVSRETRLCNELDTETCRRQHVAKNVRLGLDARLMSSNGEGFVPKWRPSTHHYPVCVPSSSSLKRQIPSSRRRETVAEVCVLRISFALLIDPGSGWLLDTNWCVVAPIGGCGQGDDIGTPFSLVFGSLEDVDDVVLRCHGAFSPSRYHVNVATPCSYHRLVDDDNCVN